MNSPHSDTTTNGLRIQAAAQFLARESEPDQGRYVFSYAITMTNVGDQPVRLQSRKWVILDADGRKEVVKGRGVVGAYPYLQPGESYTYKSYCPLATAWGTMEGSYQFARDDGTRVEVTIGRFFLVPRAQSALQNS